MPSTRPIPLSGCQEMCQSRLPLEILDCIFQYFYDPARIPVHLLTLVACCLVCIDWRDAAHPVVRSGTWILLDLYTVHDTNRLAAMLDQMETVNLPRPRIGLGVISDLNEAATRTDLTARFAGEAIVHLLETLGVEAIGMGWIWPFVMEHDHVRETVSQDDDDYMIDAPRVNDLLGRIAGLAHRFVAVMIADPTLSDSAVRPRFRAFLARAAPTIRALDAWGYAFDEKDAQVLERCTTIESLCLFECGRAVEVVGSRVGKLKRLKRLVIEYEEKPNGCNRDVSLILRELARSNQKIESLALSHWWHCDSTLVDIPAGSIMATKSLQLVFARCHSWITSLAIRRNDVVDDDVFSFIVAALVSLTCLDLSYSLKLTGQTTVDPNIVPKVTTGAIYLPHLTELRLTGCPRLHSEIVSRIVDGCPMLATFAMSDRQSNMRVFGNGLREAGFKKFADYEEGSMWRRMSYLCGKCCADAKGILCARCG